MPPSSYDVLLQDTLGLITRAFGSIGGMFILVFETFLKISPLPDEVDFFIFFGIIIWFIMWVWRLIRGK
jgi:hypothetical protein